MIETKKNLEGLESINYRPGCPKNENYGIGLIACGGVTNAHLKAYNQAGFKVNAFYDIYPDNAKAKRDTYYPEAVVCSSLEELLSRDDVVVADIAAHTGARPPLIEQALKSGKHVLSQKPFVHNLDQGEALVKLAEEKGLKLAVNQNGRWSPHWRYMTQLIRKGLIGDITSLAFISEFNHNGPTVKKPEFNDMRHIILYDFAVHWFDILTTFMGDQVADGVEAQIRHATNQKAAPPLLAHCQVQYKNTIASMLFDGNRCHDGYTTTRITGTTGAVGFESIGMNSRLEVEQAECRYRPKLQGRWNPDGFQGTMGELQCAIEENREPENSAKNNLRSLSLTFAAMKSADENRSVVPGEVRSIELYPDK